MIRIIRTLAFISLLSTGSLAQALPILTPTGLSPGDTYQLAFVTSTVIDATSSDIAVYNTHVQSAADAAFAGSILAGVTF